MDHKELKELCEIYTKLIQHDNDNTSEEFKLKDGKVIYTTIDGEELEYSEEKLTEDINNAFENFLHSKLWSWIQAEYIENVLGIDYHSQKMLWLQIAEILYHMGSPRNIEFCKRQIRETFWNPTQRVEYLLNE